MPARREPYRSLHKVERQRQLGRSTRVRWAHAGADALAQGWEELPAGLWRRAPICCHCGAHCTQIVRATAAPCSAGGIAPQQQPRLRIEALWRCAAEARKGEALDVFLPQQNKARPDADSSPSFLPSSAGLPCETVAHNTTQLTAPVRQST